MSFVFVSHLKRSCAGSGEVKYVSYNKNGDSLIFLLSFPLWKGLYYSKALPGGALLFLTPTNQEILMTEAVEGSSATEFSKLALLG